MDRQIAYPGQLLPETNLLQSTKDAMIGLAKLSAAMLGASTVANGFAVTPTGPASLQVLCAPGEIYSLTSIDALAFSTLPADTTHSIMKQGILLDGLTLNCPAPGTTGQSINYLIQATYQDTDATPVLLPYYNSANPSLPFSGMGNNGLTQNTVRKGSAIVSVKAGASATTGTQVTPAPDAGYVGLYVVTVAFGQTTITSPNIVRYSGAPLLPSGLMQAVQLSTMNYVIGAGAANAYTAAYAPAITTLNDGLVLSSTAVALNTGASTFSPNGLTAKPIVSLGQAALIGGELPVNSRFTVQYSATLDSWILLSASGGNAQAGRLINVQVFSTAGTFTYTPTVGTTSVIVEAQGGGGAGGGAAATPAGAMSIGTGGTGGAYGASRLTSGFSGQTVTVGAAGAPISGTNGGAGGTSSFGSLIIAPGGSGGQRFGPTTPGAAGGGAAAGNPSSGGNIRNVAGAPGGICISVSATIQFGGIGGSSFYGGGGTTNTTGVAPGSAPSPGGGGGGASQSASAGALPGGTGGPGLVTIWEYA